MKNKFIISLIFSFLFLTSGVCLAVDNPNWQWIGDQSSTGADYQFYYDSGYFTINTSFADSYSVNYGFTPAKLLMPKQGNNLTFGKLKISGTNYYFAGAVCDSEHTISTNFYWGSSHDWCEIERNETDVPIKLYALTNSGGTPLVSNVNGLTKTDIDSYFGTDSLETNGIIYWMQPYVTDTGYNYYGMSEIATTYDYPNYAQTFPLGSNSFVGTCGADSGLTLDSEPPIIPHTLCSSGTASSVIFDSYSSPRNWRWWCYGSDSGTSADDDLCLAYASSIYDSPADSPQCGYANGLVSTTEPTSSNACVGGTITSMTQNGDGSWSWSCVQSPWSPVSCSTISGSPTIPGTLPSNDSITCSISPTDLSTIADCMGSVLRWAFLPHQSTLDDFYEIPNTLKDKSPFGYFYAIADEFRSMTFTTPTDLIFTFKFNGSDVTLLDVNDFKTEMGSTIETFYFSILRALLWYSFLIWVYNKGRDIFSSNDSEK